MSTQATVQRPLEAIDRVGLSVVTSSPNPLTPMAGAMYNASLPGAHLVHIHPLINGDYVAVFREHWTDGVLGGSLGAYTDYQSITEPCYAVITQRGKILRLEQVPSKFSYTERVLQAAVSRQSYLYLIQTRDGSGYVTFLRSTNTAGIELASEEVIPTVDEEIVFDRGAFIYGQYLCVFGTDDDGRVYLTRKNWARIGVSKVVSRDPEPRQPVWEYQSDKGWTEDPDEIQPLKALSTGLHTITGHLTTEGPIGYAEYRKRSYISVVNDRQAQFYTSRGLYDPWKRVSTPVDLGSEEEYLGGTAYLQPHLPLSPESDPGFLYMTSKLVPDEGVGDTLKVSWSKLTV